jgi:hypothetical protein
MGEPPLVVGLAWFEVEAAKSVAKLRRDEKHRLGLRDKYGYAAGDPWDCEVNSAAAEIATAKAANLYWSGGVNTFKGADVGTKIQVRWSDHDYRTQKTSLIVRRRSRRPFLCLSHGALRFVLSSRVHAREHS